jgi:hypothetical protein
MAEDDLLNEVKKALGARHVVRICSRDCMHDVSDALQRLLKNAEAIRSSVSLKGVCLAIDDNYHLWDSGYVSIPYDFDITTIASEVTKLLAPVSEASVSQPAAATQPSQEVAAVSPVPSAAAPVAGGVTAGADAAPRQFDHPEPTTAVDKAAVAPVAVPIASNSFLSGFYKQAEKVKRASKRNGVQRKWQVPPLPRSLQPVQERQGILEDAAAASFQEQLRSLTSAVACAKEGASLGEVADVEGEAKEGAGTDVIPAFSRSAVVPGTLLVPHLRQHSRRVVLRASSPPPPPPPASQPPQRRMLPPPPRRSVGANALLARTCCSRPRLLLV